MDSQVYSMNSSHVIFHMSTETPVVNLLDNFIYRKIYYTVNSNQENKCIQITVGSNPTLSAFE